MAQTKTPTKKAKAKSSTSRAGSKAKSNGSSRPTRSRSKARTTPASRQSSRDSSPAETVAEGIKSARDTVGDAGQKAASATGKAAKSTGKAVSHAKVPLIAGGAALVGAASGMAISAARSKDSKVLGVKMPKTKMPKTKVKIRSKDLAEAADRVASAGEQIGRLSTGIREIQGASGSDPGNSRHRSPIEVVVQSLTRRH